MNRSFSPDLNHKYNRDYVSNASKPGDPLIEILNPSAIDRPKTEAFLDGVSKSFPELFVKFERLVSELSENTKGILPDNLSEVVEALQNNHPDNFAVRKVSSLLETWNKYSSHIEMFKKRDLKFLELDAVPVNRILTAISNADHAGMDDELLPLIKSLVKVSDIDEKDAKRLLKYTDTLNTFNSFRDEADRIKPPDNLFIPLFDSKIDILVAQAKYKDYYFELKSLASNLREEARRIFLS